MQFQDKIEHYKISELKKDELNAKIHTTLQIEDLKKSIKEFGFVGAIIINENNIIVAGNGRYQALCELNYKTIPCIKVPFVNASKGRLYSILDNAICLETGWLLEKYKQNLQSMELQDIDYLDNSSLENLPDLEQIETIESLESLDEEKDNDNEFIEEVLKEENQSIYQYNEFIVFKSKNKYDIPELKEEMLYDGNVDDVFIGRKYDTIEENKKYLFIEGGCAKVDELAKNQIIGFFAEDVNFEKVWLDAINTLKYYDKIKPLAFLTPNFSLWNDDPLPIQMWSWYRTQWVGRFYQEAGYKIIPTINYSNDKSYDFCFLGIPKNCPVVFHQIRNIRTEKEKQNFINGFEKAFEIINFKKCYLYGGLTKKAQEIMATIYLFPLTLINHYII